MARRYSRSTRRTSSRRRSTARSYTGRARTRSGSSRTRSYSPRGGGTLRIVVQQMPTPSGVPFGVATPGVAGTVGVSRNPINPKSMF